MSRFNKYADRLFDGPSPVERAKAALGPMKEILERHGHRVRGRRTHCPNPQHPDHHPSASVYVARDGDERVKCWSCGFDEDIIGVAEALGEHVELSPSDRSPRNKTRPSVPVGTNRSVPAPKVDYRVRELAWDLAGRAKWPLEWEAGTLQATLPRHRAQQEVVRNWDYLTARCDLPLVVATADILRQVAHQRWPDRTDAVEALLVEVSGA
jgi:hypothetical protein